MNQQHFRSAQKKPNQSKGTDSAKLFDQIEIKCEQWWEDSFPDSNSTTCNKGGHASVGAACSNAHALGVGSNALVEDVGSTCEREVLGKLACSKQVPVQVHSKVLEPALVHNKQVRVLVHNKVLELALVHNKQVRALAHSKVLEPALVHNKVPELALVHNKQVPVHNKVRELAHNMALEQGKLACSSGLAWGGYEVVRTSSCEEPGSKGQRTDPGSNRYHG